MSVLNFLYADRNIKIYRPEMNKITGSVTATLLLCQILFRSKNGEEFYKFKEPCSHKLYKEGDSWCEELGFSRKEFDTALSKLKALGLVKTRITLDRVTYYRLNTEVFEELFGQGGAK